jgi:hypothetical protein
MVPTACTRPEATRCPTSTPFNNVTPILRAARHSRQHCWGPPTRRRIKRSARASSKDMSGTTWRTSRPKASGMHPSPAACDAVPNAKSCSFVKTKGTRTCESRYPGRSRL